MFRIGCHVLLKDIQLGSRVSHKRHNACRSNDTSIGRGFSLENGSARSISMSAL